MQVELLTVARIDKIISTFGQERGLRYLHDYVNPSPDELKLAADQELRRGVGEVSEDNYPYPDPEPECDWDDLDRYVWNKYWGELCEHERKSSLLTFEF